MLTTLKQGYYLGIDGGASKTEAVIATESGFILGRGRAQGANPHNMSLEEAFQHIHQAVAAAKEDVQTNHPDRQISHFEAACLGLAGVDTADDRERVNNYLHTLSPNDQTFNAKHMVLVDDGLIGMKSGTQNEWGICLISGTGANCYGVGKTGVVVNAGNWGYVLGDQGSAFAVGQEILQQVMKEYDGRSLKTTITRKVLDFLKLQKTEELIQWVYRSPIPVKEIASLSQLANDEGLSDSIELSEIVNNTARELSEAYQAVAMRLGFGPKDEFDVVLIGGLFSMRGRFSDKVIRAVLNQNPQANVVFPNKSPGEGAIDIALIASQKKLLPDTTITIYNPNLG